MGSKGRIALASVLVAICTYCSFRFKRFPDKLLPKIYTDDSKLRTVSPIYTVVETSDQHCYSPEPSADFVLPRVPMGIDDSELVGKGEEPLACVPLTFGYSQEAGRKAFPDAEFPTCRELISGYTPEITLNSTDWTFDMHCGHMASRGKYVTLPAGMSATALYVRDDLENKWDIREFGGKIGLNESEFVYAGCNNTLTNANLRPKFQPSAYRRAQAIIASKSTFKRPLILLLVTIDSFSRRQFYRKLPQTASFLNSLHLQGDFSIFDYKLHNSLGPNSVFNMIPVLANQSDLRKHQNAPEEEVLGNGTLWKVLKSLGYVTLLGFESCENHFPEVMGKRVDVDHSTRAFYCAAHQLMGVKSDKRHTEQRCLGPHMSHVYLLNYSLAFLDLYQGVNQFLYLHIDTGHEMTGRQAALLDTDLKGFLEAAVGLKGNNDVVVVLQGDHGMRYGNWYTELEAFQEYKLPALFLIGETSLWQRFPGGLENLWTNSFRLVSKRDLRATILALSTEPYRTQYPVHEDIYLSRDCALHLERVNSARTCQGLGISPLQCSCSPRVSPDLTLDYVRKMVEWVVEEAVLSINSQIYTPSGFYYGEICRKVALESIELAYGTEITDKLEVIQVDFAVKAASQASFQVLMALGSARTRFIAPGRGGATSLLTVYNGHQVYGRIMSLLRKEKDENCAKAASLIGISADFCLCEGKIALETRFPALFPS